MNLSCIIIDDEPNAIKLLDMLISQCTKWQVHGRFHDALEAVNFLKENKVDFIFLDINLPQMSGMELAALLPPGIQIVFSTAYSEFALESYSYPTIDYLLKPITLTRFLSAVHKIESHFTSFDPPQQPVHIRNNDYFFVKSGKTYRKIMLADILYFEGEKEYVRLVTAQDQFLIFRRLKTIQEQLSKPFIRVHNSYIINAGQLDKIQDNHVYIGGKQIAISEKFKSDFMMLVEERSF